ncbi:NAD(P)-dependent oxidoreductase [Yoonia sp. SS1-5]|uniref:NAD(P)-dependent oxidoreductase n=1 Tax=Yoonia rhodophyticola TaxID=3137370 RepID=A0AAN0NJK9_9RHOB
MHQKITLLGTGLMGFPMSRNIARGGFDLTVWNRSRAKADPLKSEGIMVAPKPADAVANADVVISMLSDGDAVLEIARSVRPKSGATWVDMSSTKPAEARAMAALLGAADVSFLDAPVSGGSKGAEAGTLAIMVGGDQAVLDRVQDVLMTMGRPTLVGPTGAGQLAKLANQSIVAVTIAAVAEAMLLLEDGGADPAAVRAALKGGFADSTILQQHGARMTNRDFVPGGLSRLQVKDLDNVLAEAGTLALPTVQHVRDRFAHYVDVMGGGDRDHSGLFEELLARNGRTTPV